MKKRLLFICLIVVSALFFGIKLNNLIIGYKIFGENTSLNSSILKIKPSKRDIKRVDCAPYLTFLLSGIRFKIPKLDTFKSFKLRQRYSALYLVHCIFVIVVHLRQLKIP
jgi:hypothetical protein